MKHKNLKKQFIDISIIITLITAILCIIMAVKSYSEYKRGNDTYLVAAESFLSSGSSDTFSEIPSDSEESVYTEQTVPVKVPVETESVPEETTSDPEESREIPVTADALSPVKSSRQITVDFNSLKAVNSDITAWIISDGTQISYPIVTCDSEDDYRYYISHLFNGVRNKLGTLFFDTRNIPFKENNTIIYGHNMLNGTMFSSLLNYRKQSYYNKHPAMKLYTPEGNYKILVFSGYMTTAKSAVYILNLTGDAFAEYIKKAVVGSDFKTEVSVGAEDRIITLSTCDNQTSEKRYVIHGVLVAE